MNTLDFVSIYYFLILETNKVALTNPHWLLGWWRTQSGLAGKLTPKAYHISTYASLSITWIKINLHRLYHLVLEKYGKFGEKERN